LAAATVIDHPMSKTTILDKLGPIEPIKLKDALEERYLAYALSTIMHRALPDVRDGLKPCTSSASPRTVAS
jgi:DNA gyrase/topoisomerase IV subunit A